MYQFDRGEGLWVKYRCWQISKKILRLHRNIWRTQWWWGESKSWLMQGLCKCADARMSATNLDFPISLVLGTLTRVFSHRVIVVIWLLSFQICSSGQASLYKCVNSWKDLSRALEILFKGFSLGCLASCSLDFDTARSPLLHYWLVGVHATQGSLEINTRHWDKESCLLDC